MEHETDPLNKSAKNLKETLSGKKKSMEQSLKEDISVLRDENMFLEIFRLRSNNHLYNFTFLYIVLEYY